MRDGKISGQLDRADANETAILSLALDKAA